MTKKKAVNRPRKSLLFVQVETVRLFEKVVKRVARRTRAARPP